MDERKEKITTINGEEKEITIGFLSYQKRNQILKDGLEIGMKGTELDVKNIDLFSITNDVLKATIKGCTVDELKSEDGDRLFNEYFSDVLDSIGGGKKN